MPEPSPYCYVALALWVPIVATLCALVRPAAAVVWASLAGWMFLPELVSFNVPAVQGFDKHILTPVVLLASLAISRPMLISRRRWPRGMTLPAVGMFVADWGTYFSNRDPLVFGSMVLPAIHVLSLGAYPIGDALRIVVPFAVGFIAVEDRRDLRLFVSSLAFAGVVYSVFMLVEMRLSPQFHSWVYGFNPHDFSQSVRGGGYRAQVFMSHGLTVAMFMTSAVLAAAGLARARIVTLGVNPWALAAYLLAILVIDRSFAALLYALVLGPLLVLLRPKRSLRVAFLLTALACAYPVARVAGWVPIDSILEASGQVDDDRRQSLAFRFENEARLLERACERPWFGWGDWGRNRVWNGDGRDASITDGYWIILIGCRGFLGWAFRTSFLVIPIWTALRRVRFVSDRESRVLLATVASILAAYVVDTIPNSIGTTCVWTYAGALLRASHRLSRSDLRPDDIPAGATYGGARDARGAASCAS